MKELETEQERLNDYCLLLTSNFAQLQLRVQQVMMVPKESREVLMGNDDRFLKKD